MHSRRVVVDWKMRPSEKYYQLMKIARLCARACGADVADPKYRVNFVTACVIFCITMYFIFSIYTVQLKFHENWGILLESFCMVGSVLQGITKLLSGIFYTNSLTNTNIFLGSTYMEYEIKNNEYVEVLNKCITRVALLLKSVAITYLFLCSWFLTVPLILYAITGRRYMSMQFFLPGLDVETDFGYYTTIAMQSACLVFGGFGNFAGDVFMMIFNTHVILFADILNMKVSELNEIASSTGQDEKNATNRLRDIAEWHQKYISFAQECNTTFYWIIFVQIGTSGLSIVLTLYLLLEGDWPGSYAYLALEFSMLYLYCGIGTLVEITNDRFCDAIYAITWYELSVSQQKSVLLMLMKSQDPNLITVGGVMPLSVNTGLQVTKSVYSIMMMIMNFIE